MEQGTLTSSLPAAMEGYGSESHVWQGDQYTEGPGVVSDATRNEMMELPRSLGGERGCSILCDCPVHPLQYPPGNSHKAFWPGKSKLLKALLPWDAICTPWCCPFESAYIFISSMILFLERLYNCNNGCYKIKI